MPMTSIAVLLAAVLFQAPVAAPATAPGAPIEEAAQLVIPSGTLAGTLLVPSAPGKVPVALIIAGSGPTDRDGNSPVIPGKNNAYKQLAEALAREGIASLRYDKRGIAASRAAAAGGEVNIRFESFVDDAAAWIRQLQADKRFSRILVIGHSEGSLIGILAARTAGADALVSIAGVAHRASDVLRDQLRPQIGAMEALWQANETVLSSLEQGTAVDTLPAPVQAVPPVASLYRPSVQPYLISWFKYVPSTELAAVKMPVLLIQGTTDIQVSVDEAKALKAAKPDAELVVIEGMNHLMKPAPLDRLQNIATYGNPDLTVVPDVAKAIVALVRRIAAAGAPSAVR
jgi:pimeloyl-ACP methyl ester carboxylesterase